MDYKKESLQLHKDKKGKLGVYSKVSVENKTDLSLAYSPGVAWPSREIAEHKEDVYTYTMKGNTVAVVSDGSAVLGLGNIGPEAALPVMEGKALLFKEFAGVDAFPLVLDTQDTDEIVSIVRAIAPGFGGINLEDISAPRCFEIESRLQDLGIPVFHDDQHGTAIVVLAGLINALKVVGKELEDIKVTISGVGAAGVAIYNILKNAQVKEIVMCDSKGIISPLRNDLNSIKQVIAEEAGHSLGSLKDAVDGSDVFIGVSAPGVLTPQMITSMNDPVVFALANPDPEILPDQAHEAGARVVATGRSDFPNQVNNVLAFPGIFKGALEARAPQITEDMKMEAARALSALVSSPSFEEILPNPFDSRVASTVSEAVKNAFSV